MKTLLTIPLVLMSLVSFPSWGLTIDDLVERDGVYYEKSTDVPFTGEVNEGWVKGSLVSGIPEGLWKFYEEDQLIMKGKVKNGRTVGVWEVYDKLESAWSKSNLIDLQETGFWETFYENGQVKSNGNYENGRKEGYWEGYHLNGQLFYKGNYKNGSRDGLWVE